MSIQKRSDYHSEMSSQSFCNLVPLVSVIVSARNEQAHIERCLSSLLDQSYPNLEVIAVDDNSNDATLENNEKHQKNKTDATLGRAEDYIFER